MSYVNLEEIHVDVNCPHCNQALKINADNSKEFEIMKSLKSFNTNVRCPTCAQIFFVQLKDNKWQSSTNTGGFNNGL